MQLLLFSFIIHSKTKQKSLKVSEEIIPGCKKVHAYFSSFHYPSNTPNILFHILSAIYMQYFISRQSGKKIYKPVSQTYKQDAKLLHFLKFSQLSLMK